MSTIAKMSAEWIAAGDAEYHCKPLNNEQYWNCAGLINSDRFGEAWMQACMSAVIGWRNIEREFSRPALREHLLNDCQREVIMKLGSTIIERAHLSETEEKKS